MTVKKNILAIVGSASAGSANHKLVENLALLTDEYFNLAILADLKTFPHFDTELSIASPPIEIVALRNAIDNADGVLICTPEYVFSIPSGLKNAIEWCVSTTVFSDKPIGIITASARGEKAHEELQLIMGTLTAKFTPQTVLLISGIKGKITEQGEIINSALTNELQNFAKAFEALVENGSM